MKFGWQLKVLVGLVMLGILIKLPLIGVLIAWISKALIYSSAFVLIGTFLIPAIIIYLIRKQMTK